MITALVSVPAVGAFKAWAARLLKGQAFRAVTMVFSKAMSPQAVAPIAACYLVSVSVPVVARLLAARKVSAPVLYAVV